VTRVRFYKADGTLDKEVDANPGQRLLDVARELLDVLGRPQRCELVVESRHGDRWQFFNRDGDANRRRSGSHNGYAGQQQRRRYRARQRHSSGWFAVEEFQH